MKESHKHPYLSGEDILLFILLSSTEMISCCAPISPLRDITRPNIKQRMDWCNVWLILYLFLHSFLSTSAKYNSNNLVFLEYGIIPIFTLTVLFPHVVHTNEHNEYVLIHHISEQFLIMLNLLMICTHCFLGIHNVFTDAIFL